MLLSRNQLDSLPDVERQPILEQISAELTARIFSAADFDEEVNNIIRELRELGHDLWCFDSDGEWQLWCGSWSTSEKESGKLILDFDPENGVEASWSKPEK